MQGLWYTDTHMNVSSLVLNQVVLMLVLMALGYLAVKKKFLSSQGSKDLSYILMYIVSPAVMLRSFMIESSPEKTQLFFQSIGLGLVAFFISVVVAYLVERKHPLFNFGITFSNVGFIGVPLVYSTLGPDAVFYILPFLAIVTIAMWTYGVYTVTQDAHRITLMKIIANPVMWFLGIGLIVYFTQWPVPTFARDVIMMITPLNAPLAMFVVGALLTELPLSKIFSEKKVYWASFIRLIVIPLITLAVFVLIPGSKDSLLPKVALLMVASAPSGANTAIFAHMFDLDATEGVQLVCFSTLSSVLTLPLIIYIFERFI